MGKIKFFWARETEADPSAATKPGTATLADRIASGPLPIVEALRYAIAISEALRVVHGRNRVYSFLHPAHITIVDDQLRLAPGGPPALTPYFSPEQLFGRDLDPRSDIFSLGAVLYEMLAGRKAFDAPTRPALRIEILDREPAPLENLPPALWRLLRRCLEKKPERRMQRMEILLAGLKLEEIIATAASGAAAATGE